MKTQALCKTEDYCKERSELLARVKKIIINNLNLDLKDHEIDDDSGLFGTGLGLDSIDALDLVIGVEEEFGIKIGENELKVFRSVNSLTDYIYAKINQVSREEDADNDIPNDNSAYYFVRNASIMYEYSNDIYEIPFSDENLEMISKIISGKTVTLEPNKCMQSLILDQNGKIVDVVYIMMFEDKFWILASKGNRKSEELVMSIPETSKITAEYKCLTIEGPYSWSLAKKCFGFEILGLTYARFIELDMEDQKITVARLSTTGEYGYRIFVKADGAEKIAELIRNETGADEFKEVSGVELEKVLKVTAMEGRAVQQNDPQIYGTNPIQNELRWMIDFKKSEYNGKDAIENELVQVDKRIVAFVVNEDFQGDLNMFLNKSVIDDGWKIGTVINVEFSPLLNKVIGYCAFAIEWGYAGLDGLTIEGLEYLTISTVSTPVFIPKSSKIQIQ